MDRSISLDFYVAGKYMETSSCPLNDEIVCIQRRVLTGILFSIQSILFNLCFKEKKILSQRSSSNISIYLFIIEDIMVILFFFQIKMKQI